MSDSGGGSTGGAGTHFYSFDYTNYNPSNDGFIPQYQAASDPQFFPSMAGYNPGEGTFQTIPGSFSSRLRRISDFEPVKHKRSRNGCYTCRARRVKCDEERPRCGRCAKSKRECVFPELPKNASSKDAPAKSDDDEVHSPDKTDDISSSKNTEKGDFSETTMSNDDHLYADSFQTSPMSEKSDLMMDIASFPVDVYVWMEYFNNQVSHHHYGFIDVDEGNALKALIAQHVYNDNALVYAVAAFCAFLRTVALGRNSLEDFLAYYNASMSLLRTSLSSSNRLSVYTLMTVLQLGLLEEYLGDWVNLQSHQKAALSIITEMFDPNSIAQEPSNRILLHWYIRFDQFSSFISQNETSLALEWWEADCTISDNDLNNTEDEEKLVRLRCEKDMRWVTKDISMLFARIGSDPAAVGADREKFETLATSLETWRFEFEMPLLRQARMPLSPTAPLPTGPSTGDANESKRIWAAKHLLVHFWNLQLVFQYLLAMVQQQMPSESFSIRAKRNCDLMQDIIENDPHPDAIIGIRGPLAIHGIALGHDPERAAWCQSQLSHIESRGYLYPSTFRKHVPDTTGNVMEAETEANTGIKPMIQVVREWIDERSNTAHDTQTENIRQMAGIFRPLED